MGLITPDKLAAVLRLFKYRLGMEGPPMLEAVEGVPVRYAPVIFVGPCVRAVVVQGWSPDSRVQQGVGSKPC
jgi:hypothetical protein